MSTQLGDMVQFDEVAGYHCQPVPLGYSENGLVTAETWRIDDSGQRVTVLIVAVSLKRRYRVRPDKVTLLGRGQGAAPALATTPPPMPSGAALQPLGVGDHVTLAHIIAQIDYFRGVRAEFSAWDVTVALRRANPQADIPHGDVRGEVHGYMAGKPDYVRVTVDQPVPHQVYQYAPGGGVI